MKDGTEREVVSVSVVIPCYNYGRYLLEALDSCLESTFSDLEVLIVDDGSTDPETIAILDRIADPRTRVIRQPNLKLPAARNRGFREARGRYILPLDADDLIHPTLIEKAVWALENHAGLGFVSFWIDVFGSESWIARHQPFNFHDMLHVNHVSVTSLVRRSAWQQVGGYNEGMTSGYEDWEFWIRLGEAGWQGHLIEEPLFRYRKHGNSMITNASSRHDKIVNQIRRYHPHLYTNRSNRRLKLDRSDGSNQEFARLSPATLARKTLKHLVPEAYRPEVLMRLRESRAGGRRFLAWLRQARHRVPPACPNLAARPCYRPTPPASIHLSFLNYSVTSGGQDKPHATLILPDLIPGGIPEVWLDLVRTLETGGFALTVVTTRRSDPESWHDFQPYTRDVFSLPGYGLDPRQFPAAIAKLIESRRSDIVFLLDCPDGAHLLPSLRARFPRVPLVAWTHASSGADPTLEWLAEHAALVTRFVTASQQARDALVRLVGENRSPVQVIPTAVDTKRFAPREDTFPNPERIVGFVGHLDLESGITKFLRIAIMLSEADPEDRLRFVVVGDGELGTEARAQARSSGIGDRITFTGRISDPERFLASMDLLIAPSKRTRTSKSALEAMAAGVPVLASRTAGWPGWFEDGRTVYLEDLFDEVGFARRALQILDVPEGRDQLLQRARQIVLEDHSVRKFQDSVGDLLSDVLPSCPPDLT